MELINIADVREMSLITLTFGYGNNARNNNGLGYNNLVHTKICSPASNLKYKKGTLKVKKVCEFFNLNELYVIGEVLEGAISQSMKATINGNECIIKEIESKYGAIGKKGSTVGALVEGLDKEDIEVGQELHLGLE
jgi:hypothetical protein